MASIGDRLKKLEAKRSPGAYEIPIEVRTHLKYLARQKACQDGFEPPPYLPEEIQQMREDDFRTAADLDQYRGNPGWQSKEAQRMIDVWEEQAHDRLRRMEDLPPERWHEVYDEDERYEEDTEGAVYE